MSSPLPNCRWLNDISYSDDWNVVMTVQNPRGTNLASLLLLADSRFPTGGHAHSGGVESVHALGLMSSIEELELFIDGRLATSAATDAAFAAAACAQPNNLFELDHELEVRTPSPKLRDVSRSLGRQMIRVALRAWPNLDVVTLRSIHVNGPMQPIALGAVAYAAQLSPQDAALCSLHHFVGMATTAAVRLVGLDPFDVQAIAARIASRLDDIAVEAALFANKTGSDLPASTSLLADMMAEHHATWEVRLFAS